MIQSRLFSVYSQLNRSQLTKLGLMVTSPYFNKKEAVTRLHQFLLAAYPNYTEAELSYEKASKFILKSSKVDKKRLSYLATDLLKIIEKLLALDKLDRQPALEKAFVLESYSKWGLDTLFSKTINHAYQELRSSDFQNADYYYQSFLLQATENLYFDQQKKHQIDTSLQKAIDSLDTYYLAQKLKYCCEMVNRQNVMASQYEIKFMEEILSYLDAHPIENCPIIAIYTSILKGLINPDETSHFEQLKALLISHSELFSKEEARGMYIYSTNYCVKKIHGGKQEFYGELFQLYQTMLDKKLLMEGDYISPWTYMNIITVGIRNDEFIWTEQFIKNYKNHLHPKFKSNAYNYNLATLYYHQQELAKAMELLWKVEFDDVFYSCESKVLLHKIYFETGDLEPLLSLSDAFKIYLRRNKLISDDKKAMYLNFSKFIARLAKLNPRNNKALDRLQNRIKATPKISNRKWLEEKAGLSTLL